jgi:hypothetical protein
MDLVKWISVQCWVPTIVKCWFIKYIRYVPIAFPLYCWLVPIMILWDMHQASHLHYLIISLLIGTILPIQCNYKWACHCFASLPVAIIYHLYRLDYPTLNNMLIWYRTYIIYQLKTKRTFVSSNLFFYHIILSIISWNQKRFAFTPHTFG